MAKTKIDFSKFSNVELDQQAESIFEKMTDRADLFTDPAPALSVIQTGLADFRNAMVNARYYDRQSIVRRDQLRAELESNLRRLALYVDQVADGDPHTILAAGYGHKQTGATSGVAAPNPKPLNLLAQAVGVGTGRVKLSVLPIKTAKMYRFEYREAGAEQWIDISVTRSKVELTGLESLKLYEYRAAYLGTNPTVTYSDVVNGYAL
ncbi:hypothetical protein [Parapedobacter tibetensis]|uniref:hypothetical protein n=1 Tax=Parapedobacter tibetensis TaxID=2972951 RepID=UPI00214D3051|nr:hypothetical protein [Parapedobacter tibetensis]